MKHEEKEVPKMVKTNLLTYLTLQLNSLVDKGKGISLKEIRWLCEKQSFEICKRFPFKETCFDISILKTQPDAEAKIENIFYDMAISIKDCEMCMANNCFCFLIAYA
jgi:hypothetical protein